MIHLDQGGRKEKGSFRSAEEESFQNGVDNFTANPTNSGSYKIWRAYLKVDIVQTQEFVCAGATNNVAFNLTPDSTTNVTWIIEPIFTNGALFASNSISGGVSNTWAGTNVWADPGNVGTNYTSTACRGVRHFLRCAFFHAAFIFFISGFGLIVRVVTWFCLSFSQLPWLSRSTGMRFATGGTFLARAGSDAYQ
jgi:hypothetical protein